MPDTKPTTKTLTPADVLKGGSPCVLTAVLAPVAGLDRFQPAGFPEVGHVIYKAPRKNGAVEHVCIVDSPASMANHLESVCMRGAHDYDLAADLHGMPYLRCVTDPQSPDGDQPNRREVVVTSLTEGHRIASTYFLDGKRINEGGEPANEQFKEELADECGIVLRTGNRAHPPVEKWWQVFTTIFKYDPNALVHGVLFPKWNVKISRVLTAHLEAFGAGRVDRSGVKFDRLQKTTSGQPIFAVDDSTAREICATFILDVALLRSFGRADGEQKLGLTGDQKEFLAALALWKINQLLSAPFRFRSGCHLELVSLKQGESAVELDVSMESAIEKAKFRSGKDPVAPVVTDIFWPREELYQEPPEKESAAKDAADEEDEEETEGE
jgi:CRISPR-associated protein Csb1